MVPGWADFTGVLVELVGIEPTASSLRMTASPNHNRAGRGFRGPVRSITFHTKVSFQNSGLPGELPHSFSGSHLKVADAEAAATLGLIFPLRALHLKRCNEN